MNSGSSTARSINTVPWMGTPTTVLVTPAHRMLHVNNYKSFSWTDISIVIFDTLHRNAAHQQLQHPALKCCPPPPVINIHAHKMLHINNYNTVLNTTAHNAAHQQLQHRTLTGYIQNTFFPSNSDSVLDWLSQQLTTHFYCTVQTYNTKFPCMNLVCITWLAQHVYLASIWMSICPRFISDELTKTVVSWLVTWCFEPSQPLGINLSGLTAS